MHTLPFDLTPCIYKWSYFHAICCLITLIRFLNIDICRCGLRIDAPNADSSRKHRRGNPNPPHPRRQSLPLQPPPRPFTVNPPLSVLLPQTWWQVSPLFGVPLLFLPWMTSWTPTVACRGAVTPCPTPKQPPTLIKTMDPQVTIVTWATSTICSSRWCQIKWTKWTGIRYLMGPCRPRRSPGPITQTV